MKKLLFFLLGCLLTLSSLAQLSVLDEKYGFRNAKFESLKSSFCCLNEIEKGFYVSRIDELTLGEFKLDKILYNFFENQLGTIMIYTKGYVNSRGVLEILQTAYGKGYQSNQFIERYIWFGKEVTMIYDQNSITDDAVIIITSNKISDLEKESSNVATRKATNNL